MSKNYDKRRGCKKQKEKMYPIIRKVKIGIAIEQNNNCRYNKNEIERLKCNGFIGIYLEVCISLCTKEEVAKSDEVL